MTAPLRVTMIISRFSPSIGGTERQALLLSKELIRRGHQVDVLTQRYANDLAADEIIQGVPVHRLPPTGNSLIASGVFLLNGLRYLRHQPPSILHAHMLATPAVLASWSHRLGRGPVIVKLACSGSYGEMAVGQSSWFGRQKLSTVLSSADRFICVTKDVAAELLAAGISSDRLAEIPNGVDTAEFAPISNEAKSVLRRDLKMMDGIWILFSGRLTRQKRPDLVMKAFLHSAARRADLNLLVVGEGEEKSRLMAQAENAGMSSRILWAGRQTSMASFYKAADLFVLPSEAEGMSNSLLEAMSTGVACIVSRTAMAQEMLGDREGLLVTPGDETVLTQAFDALASDAVRRSALGSAARQRVEAHYGILAVANQYEALYAALAPLAAHKEAA